MADKKYLCLFDILKVMGPTHQMPTRERVMVRPLNVGSVLGH